MNIQMMPKSREASFSEGKLPVIIFPTSLTFFTDDTSSHQQTVTLYNPYDFIIKFKVLSTARDKYKVFDSEGTVKPRSSTDIIFKHRDVCMSNENVQDKFRIQVTEFGNKMVFGKKDIMSILLPTAEKASSMSAEEDFKSLPLLSSAAAAGSKHLQMPGPMTSSRNTNITDLHPGNMNPSWWIIATVVVCAIILLLPLENDTSAFPDYLRVNHNQKYIAIYILGLMTAKLFRIS